MDDLSLEISAPGTAELGVLFERLGVFNSAAVPEWGKQTLSVTLRDPANALVAGGYAELLLGLAEFRAVWVAESRRRTGVGRAVMVALEAAARERGAERAFLYTYSFQARGFYETLGYRLLASLPFPRGGVERLYFVRDL